MARQKSNKVVVHLSINREIDDLMSGFTHRVVEVDNKKAVFTRTKNELYVRALEYAFININEWLK